MMEFEITLKNYRCFSDDRAARISFRKGVTAFVGPNNSGKTTILKFFYEFRALFQLLSNPTGNLIHALRNNPQGFNLSPSIRDPAEIFFNGNERDLQIRIEVRPAENPTEGRPAPLPDELVCTVRRDSNAFTANLTLSHGPVSFGGTAPEFRGNFLRLAGSQIADFTLYFDAFKSLAEMLYIGPFRNALNLGVNEDYFDIQIGQAFIAAWRAFKTGNVKKSNEAIFNLTKDIKGIFGFDDLEINPSADDQTLQVFINGKSYKLPELGSGITQFILILANAATKQPSFVLIDEPELNLHPSLQLDFLTTLASYAREGILLGTHSIGLARASAERIYSLRQLTDGSNEVTDFEATPRMSELLGELSFSGYRELGFDKILLVEGSSDVKTVQQFLRMHGKDHQIVLLPMGGSQLINETSEAELQEIKRISTNVFALIDSERDSAGAPLEKHRQAFVQNCEKAEITCHVLERRSIENYLSDRAVKKIKSDKYQQLEPYQAFRDAPLAWAKSESWRIAREMRLDDLNNTDLGQFLASL